MANDPSEATGYRVLLQVVKEKIYRDDIKLRASALAYSTLASLVPVFAIILAILSGPAFKAEQEQVFDKLASALVPDEGLGGTLRDPESPQEKFKQSFQETIRPLAEKLGAVSVFGFVVLVGTVVLLFQAAENSFNAIWQVSSQRPFFLRVAIATSMIFWGPVMLAVSVSLGDLLSLLPVIGSYIVPTLFTTAAFTAFYMLMPHARVHFRAALTGGVAAALCWELAKLLFLLYVTRVVSYNKVYGSLGLIPMLFLWVYVNWLLILYGAELAYCLQHRRTMVDQWLAARREQREREGQRAGAHAPPSLVLAAAIEVARRFQSPGSGTIRASQLGQALHIEPGLAEKAANRLVAGGILARVASAGAGNDEDPAYLPTCDPKNCAVSALLAAARDEDQPLGRGESIDQARELLAQAAASSQQRFEKLTLAGLANGGDPSPLHPAQPDAGDKPALRQHEDDDHRKQRQE